MPHEPKSRPHAAAPSPPTRSPRDPGPTPPESESFGEWPDEDASTRSMATETIVLSSPQQPPVKTRAQLTFISGPLMGRSFSISDGPIVIGRGADVDIGVDDAGASRTHARIQRSQNGRYWIEDLKSRNGTFVGGRRVERVQLESGDRINIGPNAALSFAVLDAQAEHLSRQLYESSVRDALTRAHNRRYLVDRLKSEAAYSRRHATKLSLIIFDVDHFKKVNDTYGHLAGDDVLREVAALVSRMIRTEDVFARFGGEEFIVLARGIGYASAGLFAERIRVAVENLEVASEDAVLHVTISLGYAALDELGEGQRTAEGLLRLADARLYGAKSAGRNRTSGD
jgi:diguanylate cyclase (GGDEF)-like protein